jgi:hypothetical protein
VGVPAALPHIHRAARCAARLVVLLQLASRPWSASWPTTHQLLDGGHEQSRGSSQLAHALTLIHRNRWIPNCQDSGPCRRSGHAGQRSPARLCPRALREGRGSRTVRAVRRCAGTYDRALALDPSCAAAYSARGRSLMAIGRAPETAAPVEKAIRLSPRDRDLFIWYYVLCHDHTHLGVMRWP